MRGETLTRVCARWCSSPTGWPENISARLEANQGIMLAGVQVVGDTPRTARLSCETAGGRCAYVLSKHRLSRDTPALKSCEEPRRGGGDAYACGNLEVGVCAWCRAGSPVRNCLQLRAVI